MENRLETTSEVAGTKALNPHHWVELYADYLYTYAVIRISDEELARDLVQETFLAALEKRDSFKGASSERTWLTAILKHKVIDVYRKKSSSMQKVETTFMEEDFFDANDGHWNVPQRPRLFGVEEGDPLANKEFTSILQQCMKKLPALWLSVFTMKHMDEATTEIICKELKVTASNFWVIIHRTKVNLRACLQKNWI